MPSAWPVINPGSFRHRVVIAEKAYSKSEATGEDQWTASTKYTVWASYEPEQGKERDESDTTHSFQMHKFSMWYVSGVDTTMMIQWQGRTFDIKSVENLMGLNQYLVLIGREVE